MTVVVKKRYLRASGLEPPLENDTPCSSRAVVSENSIHYNRAMRGPIHRLIPKATSMFNARLWSLIVVVAACRAAVADEAGWQPLFDGTSLAGWTQRGGAAKYRVDHGEIVGTSVPHTANSFLCTDRDYGDFVLQLEFKVHPRLNSGVQIRSQSFDEPKEIDRDGKKHTIPAGRVHGYQVEIDPSDRAWTGGIYDEGRRGWLDDLGDNEPARKAFRPGEWNQFRVECRGHSIKTWLNGVPAADLDDGMTPRGFIALQVHGVSDNADPREVRWRNIRIQEIR